MRGMDFTRRAAALGVAAAMLAAGAADAQPQRKPDLADAVAGTYAGDVISDSKGSSRSNVTLTASANSGYRFTGWTGDGPCAGTASTLVLSELASNVTCTARFVARHVVTFGNPANPCLSWSFIAAMRAATRGRCICVCMRKAAAIAHWCSKAWKPPGIIRAAFAGPAGGRSSVQAL